MIATDTLDLTLGGLILVLLLVLLAVYLARKDRVTRVKLGVFFEREREPERDAHETQVMGPWPGEKKEKE